MENGQACVVIAGTHKGKAGIVADRNVSKGGNVTITVVMADGTRFKTLERSVELRP
jgi:ribosomal protein S4E